MTKIRFSDILLISVNKPHTFSYARVHTSIVSRSMPKIRKE